MIILYYLILSLIVFAIVTKFQYKPKNKIFRWGIFVAIAPMCLLSIVLITVIFDNKLPSFYDIKKNFFNYVKED